MKLEGTSGNRDAIGARVEVRTADGVRRVRTLRAGEGYLAQSSKWLHFGLGNGGPAIAEVVVRWPGGSIETITGVQAGHAYRLREGAGTAVEWTPPPAEFLPEPPPELPPRDASTSVVLAIPLPLPDLESRTFDGRPASVFEEPLRGKRGMLVNLWATWCAPCLAELQALAAAKPDLDAAGLQVLALSVDGLAGAPGDPAGAAARLREMRFPFPAGMATERVIDVLQLANDELLVAQRPFPLPATFLVDHNWRLIALYRGPLDPDHAMAELDRVALPFEERRIGTLPFTGRWHVAPKNFVMLTFANRLFTRGFVEEGSDYLTRYARFLEPQPLFPAALASSGASCRARSDDVEATSLFRWALRLDPGNVAALHGLASILAENPVLGSLDEAASLADKAARLTEFRQPEVLHTLALCHEKRGDSEAAAAVARQALVLDPTIRDPDLKARLDAMIERLETTPSPHEEDSS